MTICAECQVWLAEGVQKSIFDLEARYHEAGPDFLYIHQANRTVEALYSSRYSCAVCARLWTWLRLLSGKLDRLLTNDEVRLNQEPLSGIVSITIERRYSPNTLVEKGGSRIHTNINSSGKGPVFKLVSQKRRHSRSASRHRQGSSNTNTLSFANNITTGPKITEIHRRYTPIVVKRLESHDESQRELEPQIIGGSRLDRVRNWISTCMNDHASCKARWDKHRDEDCFLPTRLINVGQHDNEVKLLYSSTFSHWRNINYATLSHCWGDGSFLKLNPTNHDDFLEHIPVENLGRTFQETIYLCRALDIRYLWIDSFCIIQNSKQDWLNESPLMHLVYGNSYINFAASASTDCSKGLYRPYIEALSEPIEVQLPDGRKLVETSESETSSLLGQQWIRSPLHTRGWVTQELFLSQRILHFTDVQMYWECIEGTKSEGQTGTDLGPAWRFYSLNRSSIDLDRLWRTVACHYSGTQVTFAKDKLMALTGLATRTAQYYFDHGVKAQYAAGCWEHDIVRWLLWAPVFLLQPKVDFSPIPTWSWLSLGHPIYFDETMSTSGSHTEPIMQIRHIHVVPEDENIPNGPVKDEGQIYAKSSFFQISVRIDDVAIYRIEEKSPLRSCSVMTATGEQKTKIVYRNFAASQVNVWIDNVVSMGSDSIEFECVYMLRQKFPTGVNHFGLLVQRVPRTEGWVTTYTRCGLFKLWVDSIEDDVEEQRAAEVIKASEQELVDFILV